MNYESMGSIAGTGSGSIDGQGDNASLWKYITKLEKLA